MKEERNPNNVQIVLTVEQRLNLMVLLRLSGRGKRKGSGSDNRILCRKIFTQIAIPKAELRKYEQSTPRGTWRDQEAVDGSAPVTIDLEPTLAEKLLRVIDDFENWGPDDDDWLDPLTEQLEPVGARL